MGVQASDRSGGRSFVHFPNRLEKLVTCCAVFLQTELSLARGFTLGIELCYHRGWDKEGKTNCFYNCFCVLILGYIAALYC